MYESVPNLLNDKYAAALKEVTGKTEDKDVINYISGLDAQIWHLLCLIMKRNIQLILII